MDFITVVSHFSSTATLVLLAIAFLLAELCRIDLAKMYLQGKYKSSYYPSSINAGWRVVNIVVLAFVCVVGSAQFYVELKEVKEAKVPPKPVVVVKEAAIVLDREVFYYCIDAAKSKNGVGAEQIKACKEAAIVPVSKDEVLNRYI